MRATLLVGFFLVSQLALAAPTQSSISGEIERLELDPACRAADPWCGGVLFVAGVSVTVPRNLLIDLPANRLTLRQVFEQAPPACLAIGQSGLARNDSCRTSPSGAFATLQANHDACGQTLAGDLLISNGPELVTGRVSFIHFAEGYFRINGTPGSDSGGVVVRPNDPTGTHSIQSGRGCLEVSENCSPDPRFTNDSVNFTTSFKNGYPLCIPSSQVVPGHPKAADANGVGDPLCPDENRRSAVAPGFFVNDSRRFAPIRVGDTVLVQGGMVRINGVEFLSAHTVIDTIGLSTREAFNQPDYVKMEEVVWQVAPFPENRSFARFVGLSTLVDPQVDLSALRVDPESGQNHPDPLGSTVGNPRTYQRLIGGPGGKFVLSFVVPLGKVPPLPRATSVCTNLRNAGFDVCHAASSVADEFSILNPPSREVRVVTRRRVPLAADAFPLDMRGRRASHGEWTQPLGASLGGLLLAEPGEGNLGNGFDPLVFETLPWLMDRRLSPGGCIGNCEATAQPLAPFPVSGLELRGILASQLVPASVVDRVFTFFRWIAGVRVPEVFGQMPAGSCATRRGPSSVEPPAPTQPVSGRYVEHLDQRIFLKKVQQGHHFDAWEEAQEKGDDFFDNLFIADGVFGVGANVGQGQRFTRVPRADLKGDGQWAKHFPLRATGPNGASCIECHTAIHHDGAGFAALNAIRDPLHSGNPALFVNRKTTHLFGQGAIQLLAEEMTLELQAGLSVARTLGCGSRDWSTHSLLAKGICFGEVRTRLSLRPRRESGGDPCEVDLSGVRGVDADLVVKPFQWKGSVAFIRDFNRGATHNEIGIEAVEVTGEDIDGDGDGAVNESSVGDITALTVYVASQPRPTTEMELAELGRIPALSSGRLASIERGRKVFDRVGCASCHVPELKLKSPIYSEPSQMPQFRDAVFPSGMDPVEQGLDPRFPITVDLTREVVGEFGTFQKDAAGLTRVELYSDLKRHDLGKELAESIDEAGTGASVWITKALWGVGSTAPYLHDGRATTIPQAIDFHGGEADFSRSRFRALNPEDQEDLVSFLKNLQLFKIEDRDSRLRRRSS